MIRQEIFDKVATHLLKQNAQAYSDDNASCMYLMPESGLKCAIGIFIPDGHAAQKSLGGVYELMNTYPDLKDILGIVSNNDIMFLSDIQSLHDDNTPDEWKSELRYFASRHELSDKVVA